MKIRQKRADCPYYANLYAYAANTPVRYSDPTGLFDFDTNTIEEGDTLSQIAKDCNTRYGKNYTADDLQGLNSDTIIDKDKIYAGNHLNLGKTEDIQKRTADYTSRATTQDLIEQVTPERKETAPSATKEHLERISEVARNGLLEIGAGLTIWILTGIEVRNTMLKDPKSTTQVGYGGILAGGSLIADGFVRATGNSKTTVKEDFMSLLESPLGNAVREFNNSNTNGNGRKPGRTVDFSNKKSAKKEGEN